MAGRPCATVTVISDRRLAAYAVDPAAGSAIGLLTRLPTSE